MNAFALLVESCSELKQTKCKINVHCNSDYNLDVLCLTETWLKTNDYITLNESTPQDYCYKHEPRLKGKRGGVAAL